MVDRGTPRPDASTLPISLDADRFHRKLIGELAGTLEDAIGPTHARGYVNLVGARVGRQLDQAYRTAWATPRLDHEQVGQALVDLKRRIGGTFELEHQDDGRFVFRNGRCPFGDEVIGRPSLCMMTSNVFGAIAARNLGYARVELQKTIANGDGHCRVVVHRRPDDAGAGQEYLGDLEGD